MTEASSHGDWLDLADALAALHKQLAEAQARAANSLIRLTVDEVTVEFGLELHRAAKGDGQLRFGVVSVGGGGERGRRATHNVTLKLSALTDAGGPVNVNDEDDA